MDSGELAYMSDPRGVRRRYSGQNMVTRSGTVHAAAMRVSRGELFERTACHQGLDGEPQPTNEPITCRRPECAAQALDEPRQAPRVTQIGQTFALDLGLPVVAVAAPGDLGGDEVPAEVVHPDQIELRLIHGDKSAGGR